MVGARPQRDLTGSSQRLIVLRLHAFGTAFVSRDGLPLDGAASQRRVLAVLSILAVHGTPGISRDKLLGILWPESAPDRARHALTQSLYNVRRALQCDDAILVGPDLRLNSARIGSDVEAFEEAVSRGRWREAAEAYRGPLLDGLHVAQAPEFERWLMEHRQRLAGKAVRVFETLAAQAEDGGAPDLAIDWRRRRLLIDPLDSGAVRRLVASLLALGDLAGALQLIGQYERRLHDELGMSLPPDLQRLRTDAWRGGGNAAARIDAQGSESVSRRTAPATSPAGPPPTPAEPAPSPVPGPTPRPTQTANASVEPPGAPVEAAKGVGHRHARGRRRDSWSWWLAAAVLLVTGVSIATRYGPMHTEFVADSSRQVVTGTPAMVVAPFRVGAAEPALQYLRDGMVELLSVRLTDDTLARTVDPGAVLARWQRGGFSGTRDASRAEAVRMAQELGASLLVDGSVVGGAGHVVLSANVLELPSGRSVALESVDGPPDSLTTLVDRLAARLLASDAGVGERLPVHSPPPLAAVRAFLRGQAAYRAERHADAVREFQQALAIDSTFALAALRMALAADRLNSAEQEDRAVELAWAYRQALTPADQAHLVAFAGPRYPSPSPEAEQLAAWDRATVLTPDRSEVWQDLGERFFFSGAVIGSVDWRARATAALRRALELDPRAPWSRTLLVLLAARGGDTASMREFTVLPGALDSLGDNADLVRWRVAHAVGDARDLRALRDRMPRLSTATLRWIAMSSVYDAVDVDDAERALRLVRARARRSGDVTDVLLAQHALALNEGRPVYALDLTEQLEQLVPSTGAHLRLRVLDALFGDGDTTAAAAAVARMTSHGSEDASGVQRANRCVEALWRLSRGDRRAATEAAVELAGAGAYRVTIPVSTPPRACAALLETMAAVQAARPDALARLQRLDSLMLTGPAIGDAANFAPLMVARMYERLGRPAEALQAIRRRPYMSGWPRYLAVMRREEGRFAARLQQTVGAREVLARYLALRRPEGGAAAVADAQVRAQLQLLQSE